MGIGADEEVFEELVSQFLGKGLRDLNVVRAGTESTVEGVIEVGQGDSGFARPDALSKGKFGGICPLQVDLTLLIES